MKKNRTMKVAALLLALTLMTSCFVGGTFAKYTDSDNANDTARVAKWGVEATVTGVAFATEYEIEDENATDLDLAVASSTKVVAPGTTGTFTGVALTGTPEVAVNITKTASITLSGWNVDEEFYCPITITINGEDYCGLDYDDAESFVADLVGAIEDANGYYEPGTDLSEIDGMNGDYTWVWEFNGDDEKDTKLGNQEAESANTNTITITVEVRVDQAN